MKQYVAHLTLVDRMFFLAHFYVYATGVVHASKGLDDERYEIDDDDVVYKLAWEEDPKQLISAQPFFSWTPRGSRSDFGSMLKAYVTTLLRPSFDWELEDTDRCTAIDDAAKGED
jgi:hypothetical protein